MSGSMRVLNVRAENIKGLKLVEFRPKKTTTVIGGKNAQGKTSVMDAICMALGGKKLVPSVPLRRGENSGSVRVDLKGDLSAGTQDMIVTRKFFRREDGTVDSELEIVSTDGFRAGTPQKMLDELVGSIGYDPLAFLKLSPRDQVDSLKKLLGIDTEALDKQREKLYEQRRQVGINGKAKAGALASVPATAVPEGEEMDVVQGRLKAAVAVNTEAAALKEKAAAAAREVVSQERRVEDRLATVNRLRRELLDAENAHTVAVRDLESLRVSVLEASKAADAAPTVDVTDLQNKLVLAQQIKSARERNADRAKLEAECQGLRDKYAAMGKEIDAIDAKKAALLAEAKWPLPGLSFGAEGVVYNELPLDQISTAERIRVSMAIGVASGRELNVMFIREASLLDADMLEKVALLAAEHKCQLFAEVVGENENLNHITIRGGEIVAADEDVAADPNPKPEIPTPEFA